MTYRDFDILDKRLKKLNKRFDYHERKVNRIREYCKEIDGHTGILYSVLWELTNIAWMYHLHFMKRISSSMAENIIQFGDEFDKYVATHDLTAKEAADIRTTFKDIFSEA